MIQFNLLPDVKLEFIKTERTKRLVISVSVLASIVAVAVLILLLFIVDVLQRSNLNDLNRDVRTSSVKIQSTPELNKILTIQNQLSALTGLHDQKPVASRLFTYLGQVTPSNVNISNATADFSLNTITLTGTAPTIDNINTYVDTLKFTTYTTDANRAPTKAFSNVVLASFGRTVSGATYNITLSADPIIFSGQNAVTLTVPNTVTTRSVTSQPSALFKSTVTSAGK